MSLPDGDYLIVLASPSAPPPLPVGADVERGKFPVIVGGRDNIWTATKLPNGNYTLILQRTGDQLLSQSDEEEVFVSREPPPKEWAIRKQEDGTYSIEVPSKFWPTSAWTLNSTEPGTKVTLGVYELPRPGQLWNFIPVLKD